MYCGYWYDTDTSLYQVRNRYYDANLSVFVNRDPIGYDGGDTNLYRYCGNDPVNATDPSGQHPPRQGKKIGVLGWMTADGRVIVDGPMTDQVGGYRPDRRLLLPAGALVPLEQRPKPEPKPEPLRLGSWMNMVLRHDYENWSDYKGSAADLFECWCDEMFIRGLRRDVIIKGNTPFTNELRKADHFTKVTIPKIQDEMRAYADRNTAVTEPLPKGVCTRSFSEYNVLRGASDLRDMFARGPRSGKFNSADVFLGSFVGHYRVMRADLNRKQAWVRFHVENPVGWYSATKNPWRRVSNDRGAYYDMDIVWEQLIEW